MVKNVWMIQENSLHLVRREGEEMKEVSEVLVELWDRIEALQSDAVLQDNARSLFTLFR